MLKNTYASEISALVAYGPVTFFFPWHPGSRVLFSTTVTSGLLHILVKHDFHKQNPPSVIFDVSRSGLEWIRIIV